MKTTSFILCLFLTNMSLAQKTVKVLPKLGSYWGHDDSETRKVGLTPQIGTLSPFYDFVLDRIVYNVALDKESKVTYIQTADSNMKIHNKIVVGMELKSFKNKKDIKLLSGWAHYLYIRDGWYAAFKFEQYKELQDSAKVIFVFRYKFPKRITNAKPVEHITVL